jgi:hypothetical protein
MLPSLLCHEEINVLKSSLRRCLLRLGFQNGVVHVEAGVGFIAFLLLRSQQGRDT